MAVRHLSPAVDDARSRPRPAASEHVADGEALDHERPRAPDGHGVRGEGRLLIAFERGELTLELGGASF